MKPFRLWIWRILTCWLPETRGYAFKARLLRWCGAEVGNNVRIVSGAEFVGNGRLVIGDDVFIGAHCRISPVEPAGVVMGSHIDLAPEVLILTGSHKVEPDGEHIGGDGTASSVRIGDGCWLGARSVILPGVSLPEKTLVAAGAVVVKSVSDARSMVAGVPAVVKKRM